MDNIRIRGSTLNPQKGYIRSKENSKDIDF